MSSTDYQEIITTPEAKGARLLPSSRGVSVNFSRLNQKREMRLKIPRSVPVGRNQTAADYIQLKNEAMYSSLAARALQLLQSDPQATEAGSDLHRLHSPVDFAGLDDTAWAPPDSQIAAGPDHLLVTVNATLAEFDKTGRQLLRLNLSDLFSQLVQDAIIFNPRVIYDQFRNGWIMAACARSVDERSSWLLLAFSEGEDPLGQWWVWALDASFDGGIRTGNWADGIGLAVDNNSLYLTANMFGAHDQFIYSKLRVLNKKELQSGAVLHGWDFWGLRNTDGSPAFGVQPALNMRAAGAQYFLNAANDGEGLTLWTFTQPPRQNPILSRRFVPTVSFQLAPNARQPLTDVEIETGDTRLTNVVFRHGLLWAAHTISANWGDDANLAAIQWFQINPRAGCVIQQGIYGAPHYHYFCPAVMPDGAGNLVMVFNRAGDTEFPSIRFTGRLASDEANTLQASDLLQQSSSAGSADWSVASSATNAPDDPVVWMIGQYAATDEDWATWIGAATCSEPDAETTDHYSDKTACA
jgi:hypothetical protein